MDDQAVIHAAKLTDAVVIVEEHQKAGGLGGAVAELLGERYPAALEIVAVDDSFGESGKPGELLHKYGLTNEEIVLTVKKILKRKNK